MSSTTRKRRRSSGAADEEDVEDMQLTRMDNVFPPHAAIRSSHNKFLVNDCLSFLQASVQQHNINIVACLAVVSRLWSGEDDDWSIIQIKLVEGLMPQQRNSKHILNAFSKVSAPERSVSDNVDDFGYWPRLLVASRSFSENVWNSLREDSKDLRKTEKRSFYLTLADLLMEAVIRAFLAEEDAGEIIEIDEDDAANDRETSIAIKARKRHLRRLYAFPTNGFHASSREKTMTSKRLTNHIGGVPKMYCINIQGGPAKFLSRSDVMLCRGVPPCCSPTPYTLKMAPTSMTAIYDVFPIASLPSSSPLVLLTHPSKQCACVPPRLAIQQNSEDDDNASDENNDNASDQQTSDHAESTRDSRPLALLTTTIESPTRQKTQTILTIPAR
ncbi:hypothetical protein BC829DRAFT_412895 [Chytridium lagenaria]|nr:hypothetical protein BC829DRAFT_412895 [Chytridium lagenaria]